MFGFLKKILGSKSDKDLKGLYPLVDKINSEFDLLSSLSDDELRGKTKLFKEQITNNLKRQRRTNETSEPFGILTHHLNMIESDWEEFRNIFTILKNSNSVRCVDPLELFH